MRESAWVQEAGAGYNRGMDARRDLGSVARDELLALVDAQSAVITRQDEVIAQQAEQIRQHAAITAALQERIRALEQKLAGRGGPGMPGIKPARVPPPPPEKPRKQRGQGFGRPRLPPTETVQHALGTCPD